VTAAALFCDTIHDGRFELPLPGHGRTAERLLRLAGLGRADLVTARLGEGHADAIAIRAELGDNPAGDPAERWRPGPAGRRPGTVRRPARLLARRCRRRRLLVRRRRRSGRRAARRGP
jgi:hypothetical protein